MLTCGGGGDRALAGSPIHAAVYSLPVKPETTYQRHHGREQPIVNSLSVLESRSLNPVPRPALLATFPLVFLPFRASRLCLCSLSWSSVLQTQEGSTSFLSDLCFLPAFLPHTPPPSCFLFNEHLWGLPGGPVVKNLPCNAGAVCLMPSQGTKIPQAAEQLSL